MKYELTLTEEQAKTISKACEFYARILLGQFDEITWHTMLGQVQADDYIARRDYAEALLYEARKQIYPELMSRGHSYGLRQKPEAEESFGIHEVIRYGLGIGYSPKPFYKSLPEMRPLVDEAEWEEVYDENDEAFFRRKFYCKACGRWNTYGKTEYCPKCGNKMKLEDKR